MNTQANRSPNTTKVITTISCCNLALLSIACNYISKKETSQYKSGINMTKRMKLWHQPSVHPTVRKVELKGRNRTKKFAKRAKLTFCKDVKVYEIPSRHDYSPQVKSLIWRGMNEIRTNAKRNYTEFESEGGDWRTVVEDDDMHVDAETGELIHPCWVDDEDSDYSDFEEFSDDEEISGY